MKKEREMLQLAPIQGCSDRSRARLETASRQKCAEYPRSALAEHQKYPYDLTSVPKTVLRTAGGRDILPKQLPSRSRRVGLQTCCTKVDSVLMSFGCRQAPCLNQATRAAEGASEIVTRRGRPVWRVRNGLPPRGCSRVRKWMRATSACAPARNPSLDDADSEDRKESVANPLWIFRSSQNRVLLTARGRRSFSARPRKGRERTSARKHGFAIRGWCDPTVLYKIAHQKQRKLSHRGFHKSDYFKLYRA